jgi:hypothetical protein
MRAAVLATSLVALVACGVGDAGGPGGGGADAGASAADASSGNALGQTCTDTAGCPTSPAHQCVFLTSGNPSLGYCSPVCSTDADCQTGYTGPSTGGLTCFVPNVPQACTITCSTTADCPGDLECKVTGGPVNVCATR